MNTIKGVNLIFMEKGNLRTFITVLLVFGFGISYLHSQDIDSLIDYSLEFAKNQLAQTVVEVGDTTKFPRSTLEDGSWKLKDAGSWTTGFFPGCLWYMYEWTSDEKWKMWAESWTAGVENEKYNTETHDVGFMIFCSFGNGYRLTGREEYREVIIQAARSLVTRYNPTVGCIRSWDRFTYPVIIDNMMNLELLFWASKNGGESEWYDFAVSHALKTRENNVRENGSTFQIVDYDPSTGEVIQRMTHQGYRDTTTWSRGQAWGLYGFTMTYRETGDPRFLETAQSLADFFIDNLSEDYIPYWDFEAPDIPNEEKDASAAAIAVSGLLELSTLVSDDEVQQMYRNAAVCIFSSLCSQNYLAENSTSSGILLHGVGNRNKNSEVNVSLIYADYYFIEAVLRYLDIVHPVFVTDDRYRVIPSSIQLFQNYPNPFNSETTILYRLTTHSRVKLSIYDVVGRLVETLWDGDQKRGEHRIRFNGDYFSSGTYILVLQTPDRLMSHKMILLR